MNRNLKSEFRKKQYQLYIVTFIILFSIYPISKTLVDIQVFLSTNRLIGTEDWINTILLKKEEMAFNIPLNEKRILIVSGSNALFGISAETISQETGIKTINLSSHGGLGGEYILNRAERLIRKGDIILLPLEYPFYSSSISDDFKKGTLGRFVISYDRNFLPRVSAISMLDFILNNAFSFEYKKEYISYFQGKLSKAYIWNKLKQKSVNTDDNCYSGLTLNEYGDETCNIRTENVPVNPAVLVTAMPRSISDIDPDGYIERFVRSATEKGAKIVPLYPASTYTDDYKQIAFQESAQNIKKFWEDLGIEFQDSLMDSLLPPSMMYNTKYHPKDVGRKKRTTSIIKIIKNKLKSIEE